VYAVNSNTDGVGGVSQYVVGAGGALTPMATPTVAVGDDPEGVVVLPDQGQVAAFAAKTARAGPAGVYRSPTAAALGPYGDEFMCGPESSVGVLRVCGWSRARSGPGALCRCGAGPRVCVCNDLACIHPS
jgi:hypothetical protein